MTPDDILRMAREAGLMSVKLSKSLEEVRASQLERFAHLVAAHEREACAAICDEESKGINPQDAKIMALMIGERIRARGAA